MDWDSRPEQYVDLNKPVLTFSKRQQNTSASIKEALAYPIADPTRFNGKEDDLLQNTEGFTYGMDAFYPRINGVDPNLAKLSMPVQWVYILEDGTMGTLDDKKTFRAFKGAQGGGDKPSKEIPIIARVAWWTDDETCKINVIFKKNDIACSHRDLP